MGKEKEGTPRTLLRSFGPHYQSDKSLWGLQKPLGSWMTWHRQTLLAMNTKPNTTASSLDCPALFGCGCCPDSLCCDFL